MIDWGYAFEPVVAAWLLNLAVHSTVLLGVVLAVTRLGGVGEQTADRLLRFALVAPFVTATVQLGFVEQPWFGLVAIGQTTGGSPGPAPAVAPVASVATSGPATVAGLVWPRLALFAVLAWAMLSALLWSVARWRLWRELDARRQARDPRLRAAWSSIATGACRLSCHDRLATPIAFGVRQPEVCVPSGLIGRLDDRQLRGMLAHEVSHLAARDPLWLAGISLAARVFPWQPLFRLARRRFVELAELRCDARAAETCGRRAVASCLVEVAGWMTRASGRLDLATMAGRPSFLRRRIERLLDEPIEVEAAGPTRWTGALMVAVLVTMPAAMPAAVLCPAPVDIRATVTAELAQLDTDCAALAREFMALYRALDGVRVDAETRAMLGEVGRRLNALEARRIRIRTRIVHEFSR